MRNSVASDWTVMAMPKGGTPGRTWINARNKDSKNEKSESNTGDRYLSPHDKCDDCVVSRKSENCIEVEMCDTHDGGN